MLGDNMASIECRQPGDKNPSLHSIVGLVQMPSDDLATAARTAGKMCNACGSMPNLGSPDTRGTAPKPNFTGRLSTVVSGLTQTRSHSSMLKANAKT